MTILWTALRLPNLAAWGCCGLAVCVGGLEYPDHAMYRQDPALWGPVDQEPARKPQRQPKPRKPQGPMQQKPMKQQQAASHFLGFELPVGSSIGPDEPQHFEVVPVLSRVGVDMSTPIGSVTAKSSAVRGGLAANPKTPEVQTTAWMVVATGGLSTGNRSRDAMLHDALKAKTYPEIRFTLRSFEVAKMDADARKLTGTAACTMWICGRAQRLEVFVEAQRDRRQLLVVTGQVKLRLSEMGVEVPRTLGIPLIHDEITLWLAVRGRRVGSEPQNKAVARAR